MYPYPVDDEVTYIAKLFEFEKWVPVTEELRPDIASVDDEDTEPKFREGEDLISTGWYIVGGDTVVPYVTAVPA